jgi:hypothetical protein
VWVVSVGRDVRMYTPDLVKNAASWASRPPSDARPKCFCAISRLGTSCPTHPQAGAAVCRQLYEAHGPPPLISIPTQAYFILLHPATVLPRLRLLDQHVRINAVRVDGVKNTGRSLLASLVYPHLPQHPHSSFESVLHATHDKGHYLVQSDISQAVHARLGPSADATTKPSDVDVFLLLLPPERAHPFLSQDFHQSREQRGQRGAHPHHSPHAIFVSKVIVASQIATSRIRNVFGGGETFEANVSFGTQTHCSFHATFTTPIACSLDTHGELSVFALNRDNTSYMSATETLRGARAVINPID